MFGEIVVESMLGLVEVQEITCNYREIIILVLFMCLIKQNLALHKEFC